MKEKLSLDGSIPSAGESGAPAQRALPLPADITKLEQVEKIDGRVLITHNKAITKLNFLKNLNELSNTQKNEYKHNLLIYGNENLNEIEFSDRLSLDPKTVFIRVNPQLTRDAMKKANLQVEIGDSTGTLG
ncbi:hypothetical protein ANCDUO_06983 [Ancylostoma duodenale]|uniref:Receptor L-domain domain-containing protein n=1 Tax=Ancylostoma duodenale TaxID=51022 RepID=A0A0C2H048_9BILA|nr:hypothetical protein ANCDUO_06983 [Ancylostoma duodenale]